MAKKELDRFDTKAKRNMKISTKLMLLIGASVIVSSVGVSILSLQQQDDRQHHRRP